MSTRKSFDLVCVVVLVFTVLLTILFMNGSALGIETVDVEKMGFVNA